MPQTTNTDKYFTIPWKLHIAVLIAMYGYYIYLWVDYLFLYDGKAGWRGFELFMFTCFTAPFYIFYHLYTLHHGIRYKYRHILTISFIGILLCTLQTP
ncbi:MAG: hypothetical protein ACLGH8_06720 [Bacteroidia bacterium]